VQDQEGLALTLLLFLATCFLAYSNGANDNFKGVASLFGSRATSYRVAIAWATVTTFGGSIASIFLAQKLLTRFSGKGSVPDQFVGSEYFLLAVALGAGATVIAATLTGFPVSTTHALTGAIMGSGMVPAGSEVNVQSLGKGFLLPLLLSPILAIALAGPLYLLLRLLRLRFGISKEWCICLGETQQFVHTSACIGYDMADGRPSSAADFDWRAGAVRRAIRREFPRFRFPEAECAPLVLRPSGSL
jgi:inorganic phosphate transporter, PiT family